MFLVIADVSKIFPIFSQFPEKLVIIAFMFSTSLFLPVKYGKRLFLKQIFLTFLLLIQSNCILQSKKYVPARSLWLNRVFSDLANSYEKHCLTIDCGYLNKNGPGRY